MFKEQKKIFENKTKQNAPAFFSSPPTVIHGFTVLI